MPLNLKRFEMLMYGSAVVTVFIGVLDFGRFAPITGPVFILGMIAISVALAVVPAWLIARMRQGWARWLLLALVLVGIPGFVQAFVEWAPGAPITATLNVLRLGLQVAALYYVFSDAANAWFKARPVR
jgi:hypothetical protein